MKFLKVRLFLSFFETIGFFKGHFIFRSLSFLTKLISGKYYVARGKSINGLIEKIQSNRINTKVTLGGCFIEKINKTILISREKSFKN